MISLEKHSDCNLSSRTRMQILIPSSLSNVHKGIENKCTVTKLIAQVRRNESRHRLNTIDSFSDLAGKAL